jgi:protein TonB
MNKHAKSLTLSLFIHTLLLVVLFFIYTKTSKYIQPAQKKQKICIKLNAVQSKKTKSQKQQTQKQQIKRVEKPKKRKTLPKKVKPIHKKYVHKKVVVKKRVQKKIQKPVIKKEEIKEKQVKEPKISQEIIKPQTPKLCASTKQNIAQVVVAQKTVNEKYIENNLQKIAALIQDNLYYPRRARMRGIEGIVVVRFVLHKDATVTQITTTKSSSGILARAAIRTIAELSGKFPQPIKDLVIRVPINYSLH